MASCFFVQVCSENDIARGWDIVFAIGYKQWWYADIALDFVIVEVLVASSGSFVEVASLGALGTGVGGRSIVFTLGVDVIDDVMVAGVHLVSNVFI